VSPPFVSVVVPLHNEEQWIDECVQALLEQDYPADRYEILVVDNNSSDGSAARVARYPRVRLLQERVQGDYAARNRGISESSGSIIAFTDSDTAPERDWLREIVRGLEPPGTHLLIGRLRFGNGGGSLALLEQYEAEKGAFIFSAGQPGLYFGYTCNMAVTKTLIDTIGPFAPVFRNADVVLVRRAVDELSPSALAYCDTMRVRRLEVATVGQYLGKQIAYGRDFARYASLAGAETLSTAQRFEVFRRASERNGYGYVTKLRLLGILGVGAVCYDVMRRIGLLGGSTAL
jgi:glycosyltransferase involved in cell wall biosynthesis